MTERVAGIDDDGGGRCSERASTIGCSNGRAAARNECISNTAKRLFLLFYFSYLNRTLFTIKQVKFSRTYIGDRSNEVTKRGTSKGYLERVMIDELVHIERSVEIENVRVINFPVDWRI